MIDAAACFGERLREFDQQKRKRRASSCPFPRNFDIPLDHEANLNVLDSALAAQQARVFAADKRRSREVTLERSWKARPRESRRAGGEPPRPRSCSSKCDGCGDARASAADDDRQLRRRGQPCRRDYY
jgi:hypothetical protein